MAALSRDSSRGSLGADTDVSSTSLYEARFCNFKFKAADLQEHLGTIASCVDLAAAAIMWYSRDVIEMHSAEELLKFSGGDREKHLKVLEIFGRLRRQEDRVPFFLQALLQSGEISPTNRELYDTLSYKLGFTERDVEDACKMETNKRSLRDRKVTTSRHSSGIDSSMESILEYPSSPPPPIVNDRRFSYATSDSPQYHPPTDPLNAYSLQQENLRLQQEVSRLQQQADWSFKMLVETQKSLRVAQAQLSRYHEPALGLSPRFRRESSTKSSILGNDQNRIRKISKSLDSIQHEIIRLQLEGDAILETPEFSLLNEKSSIPRRKTPIKITSKNGQYP